MWEAIDNLRGQQISERLVSINSEMIIWAVNRLSDNPVVFCEEIDSEIVEESNRYLWGQRISEMQ